MITTAAIIIGAISYSMAFALGAVIGAIIFWRFTRRKSSVIDIEIEYSGNPTKYLCTCGSDNRLVYNASGPGELGTYECTECNQRFDRKLFIADINAGITPSPLEAK